MVKNEKLIFTLTACEIEDMMYRASKKALSEFKPVATESKTDIFLTREETAKALKISLPTLSALSKVGIIVSHRLGGRVLYKSHEVAMALTKVHTR